MPALAVGYGIKSLVLEQAGLTLYLFILRINQNTLQGFTELWVRLWFKAIRPANSITVI